MTAYKAMFRVLPIKAGLVVAAALLLLAVSQRPGGAAAAPVPAAPPLGERWFGLYFNDEKAGFVRTDISETEGGYRVESDSAVKMSGMGFSRDASMRESYLVERDLALKSFRVSQTIDGTPTTVSGEVLGRTVRVTVESAAGRKEKRLTAKGTVYPSAVINLYPFLKGATAGKKYRLAMLDTESVALKDVRITAVGFEKLDGRDALRLRNNLYPFVDNDVWVDAEGNTLRESVRDGWIETRAEDGRTARAFVAESAVAGKEFILSFSLVPTDRPVERPAGLRLLELELSGFPVDFPLLRGTFQQAERREGGTVLFSVDTRQLKPPATPPAEEPADMKPCLASTDRIPADHPEIIRWMTGLVGEAKQPAAVVEKLVRGLAERVKESGDSRSALETLKEGNGDGPSQARLYLALARAAGVPTRFVSGLVNVPGKGFLYHSWAESYLGYWLPVDPFYGQSPADASHIKLVEGDSPEDLAPLADVVGRIAGKVFRTEY